MANQTTTIKFIQPGGGTTAGGVASSLERDAIDGSPDLILARAQSSLSTKAQYLATLFGRANIIVEATTDAEATPLAAELVDLTTMGGAALFPAGTIRKIRWRHWVQTENDRYYSEKERLVLGGTTPVLLGSTRLVAAAGVIAGTVTQYGRVKLKTAVASGATTEDADENDANIAIGAFTNGVATLTLPLNNTAQVLGVNFAAATYGATTGAVPHVVVTSGSTSGRVDLGAPDDGLADTNPADGTLEILFEISPPGFAELVMNSNNVEMQITGIASDATRHRVEIFIEPVVNSAFEGA